MIKAGLRSKLNTTKLKLNTTPWPLHTMLHYAWRGNLEEDAFLPLRMQRKATHRPLSARTLQELQDSTSIQQFIPLVGQINIMFPTDALITCRPSPLLISPGTAGLNNHTHNNHI